MYGVQTSYIGMRKQRVDAHPESVFLALKALGAPLRNPDDSSRALQERKNEVRHRGTAPVIVAWDGKLESRARTLTSGSKATLVLEDNSIRAWPPQKVLPFGYHRLHIKTGNTAHTALVISAPVRANFPLSQKGWGMFAPLYALHSNRTFGAGDLTDLERLMDWMHSRGGTVMSTLPLLSGFLEKGLEPSPYSPVSRLFWNEFYVDLERIPELKASNRAQRIMPQASRPGALIDYSATMRKKRKVLETLSDHFFKKSDASRQIQFYDFLLQNPEAREYARFRAAQDGQQGERTEQYYLYAQWQMQSQLRDLAKHSDDNGTCLYLDMPLGLHRNSFDAWRFPHLFVKGMSGGAPPDPVFTTGQNWAFQPLQPEAMRADGYKYAIDYVRNHLRYARLLRIDHVMGLHRLFWIPEGAQGNRGVYVEYPAEEMYAILSLESHRAGAGIVGENLGVVPPVVYQSMKRHNIRELYVAQYETAVDSGRAVLRNPPAGSIASLNTHDHFPFQAFLDGIDIDERLKLGFISPEEANAESVGRKQLRKKLEAFAGRDVFKGCIDFLVRSKAGVVLINLEDLWKETKPQNIPATTREHPNWQRRMRYSIEQMQRMALPSGLKQRGSRHVNSQRSRSVPVQRRKSFSPL